MPKTLVSGGTGFVGSNVVLSYDHRLIDGALAGRFLQRIVQLLEGFDPHKLF